MPQGGSKYTPDQREQARVRYEQGWPSAKIAADLDIPAGTIRCWAKKHGWGDHRTERTKAMTLVAQDTRKLTYEQRRLRLVELLGEIATVAAEYELVRLGDPDEEALRDIVGARTRAIHDLQLLSGEATSRNEDPNELDRELRRFLDAPTPGHLVEP